MREVRYDRSPQTVTMNPPGSADTLGGAAGAVEGGVTVRVYSDGLLTSLIGSAGAAGDGSFAAIGIGDNLYGTIYVTATDAAGNQSSPTTLDFLEVRLQTMQ